MQASLCKIAWLSILVLHVYSPCPGFTEPTIPAVCTTKKLQTTGCPVLKKDCDKCALMGCKWKKQNKCLKEGKSYAERKSDITTAFSALNIGDLNTLLTTCKARVTEFGETAFGKDEVTSVRKDFFTECKSILDATNTEAWDSTASPEALTKYLTGVAEGLTTVGWATRKDEAKNDKSESQQNKKDQMCRFRVRHYVVVCMMNIIREVNGYKRINPRAVGSTKMDSDYDVGISGPDTLKFIALFTHAFKTIFNVPSSFMFDTNLMVASAFDWMKTAEMKQAQITAGIQQGYDIITERPSKHWSMAILKSPIAMSEDNQDLFYKYELEAAHAKLCYFAENAGSNQAYEFSEGCSTVASNRFQFNSNEYRDLLKLKKDFEEKYTNNPNCNEEEQLTSADQNFIHAIYASPLWDDGSFAPNPATNNGDDFVKWQHSMTELQIISQEAYHTVGPLIVTVVLSDIMVGAFSSPEVLGTFWKSNGGAEQWVAHIPINYLETALIENYGDMYKEYSKEVVKHNSPKWTEFVFMSVKYLSRVCEAALALDSRRDAKDTLRAGERKLVMEVGATTAWIKDALRSKQGSFSDIASTLEMPSEKLGQELMKFAKNVYMRMLMPFNRKNKKDVAEKSISLDKTSELLQLVRAQFYCSFTTFMKPKGKVSSTTTKKYEGQNTLTVDHLVNHQMWEGHMPAFLIPSMDDPKGAKDEKSTRLNRIPLDFKKFSELVEQDLSKYPWSKFVANTKAYWDENPSIRLELNARFGIIKIANPSPPYVIETMEKGSKTDNVVESITVPNTDGMKITITPPTRVGNAATVKEASPVGQSNHFHSLSSIWLPIIFTVVFIFIAYGLYSKYDADKEETIHLLSVEI